MGHQNKQANVEAQTEQFRHFVAEVVVPLIGRNPEVDAFLDLNRELCQSFSEKTDVCRWLESELVPQIQELDQIVNQVGNAGRACPSESRAW